MEPVLVALAVGALLVALWAGATRRHLRRRESSAREWEDVGDRPDLWTSSARCPSCGSAGGLLDARGDEVWFTCLECSQRHRREHRA